ncbi:MAG: hypothetical protein ACP5OA_04795 [Candidatus Woesearchaeota archaeon]
MKDLTEKNIRNNLISSNNLTEKIQFNPEHSESIEHFFSLPIERRIVLLHSVRGAGSEEPEFITEYAKKQENQGNALYIPKKFNFQKDETGGIAICNTMRYVIQNSGNAAIGYNPDSEGTKFDYGMALFLDRPITLLNQGLDISEPTYDSMKAFDAICAKKRDDPSYKSDKFIEFLSIIKSIISETLLHDNVPVLLEYDYRPPKEGKPQPPALTPYSAIELGMAYASQKPFKILNLEEVKKQAKLEDKLGYNKSYSKVALRLHEIYNG